MSATDLFGIANHNIALNKFSIDSVRIAIANLSKRTCALRSPLDDAPPCHAINKNRNFLTSRFLIMGLTIGHGF
ncbi:hypothetical protein ACN4EK_27785 [Pantanalinema rosaneae CENA516]|uniref:hypothetical protein n=1 Tax=Pantanalinema rosaneae TaxID=1620701 RepID=UPI003D6E17DE